MADNLVLRGGMWHVRIDIPKDVQPAFGNRKILSESLSTGSRTEAMRLRLSILSGWKNQIQAMRELKASQAEQWREKVAQSSALSQKTLTKKVMRAVQGKPYSYKEKGAEYIDSVFDSMQPFLNEAVKTIKAAGVSTEIADQFPELIRANLHSSGVDSITPLKQLGELISTASVEMITHEYHLSPEEVKEAQSIIADPKAYKPKSPITKTMLDGWTAHLEQQIDTDKTRDMHVNRVRRLSDYLTAEGLPLSFDTMHQFLVSVSTASQTRKMYLWSGRTFWTWAIKYNAQFRDQFQHQPCPFDGHTHPKVGAASGESYAPFTKKEVESLFLKAQGKGDNDLAHLIAFGAYTGARLEEIGRISTETTIFENGEPIGFKITEAKTGAGVREVPIHSDLLPLYKHLAETAPARNGYLFAGGNNKYLNRLDALSKRFGRLKKTDFSKLHTFHSIRKTFVSELHMAGVGIEILPYIVGHEVKSFTLSVYSKGPSFQQKKEAIEKLSFSFPTKLDDK